MFANDYKSSDAAIEYKLIRDDTDDWFGLSSETERMV